MGVCPVCDAALPLSELEAHVNLHFDDTTVQQNSEDKEESCLKLQRYIVFSRSRQVGVSSGCRQRLRL